MTDNRSQSPGAPSWVYWMIGSLVPFTAFTFVPAQHRVVVGGVALAMVAVSLVQLWREG